MREDEPAPPRVEQIDLWQLHRIDAQVSVEESFGAVKALQDAGKIRRCHGGVEGVAGSRR